MRGGRGGSEVVRIQIYETITMIVERWATRSGVHASTRRTVACWRWGWCHGIPCMHQANVGRCEGQDRPKSQYSRIVITLLF
jgi:hypothetical protein